MIKSDLQTAHEEQIREPQTFCCPTKRTPVTQHAGLSSLYVTFKMPIESCCLKHHIINSDDPGVIVNLSKLIAFQIHVTALKVTHG